MIITTLAIAFILFIVVMIVFGKVAMFQRPADPNDVFTEKCSVCHEKLHKSLLIERQIGGYKMLYFCKKCIDELTVAGKKLS